MKFDFFRKTPVLPARKFGHIETIPEPTDHILGGPIQSLKVLLSPERDFTNFLPVTEKQERAFETFSCVTFSALNCLEITHKRLFGVEINASDRFIAAASGTVPGQGNSFVKVGDAIRKSGLVLEEEYTWGGSNNTEYLVKPPQTIYDKAKLWKEIFETQYEWVGWAGAKPEAIYNALQFGPVQVSVNANATYSREVNTAVDHAVTVFQAVPKKSLRIFDHYDRTVYDLPWGFYFGSAFQFSLLKKKFIPLVMVYNKPEIYAIVGTTAQHIADEATWHYGEQIGLWEKKIEVLTQNSFNNAYILGKHLTFI